jgi:hypothetical protein
MKEVLRMEMDRFTFGMTMLVIGMGGTLFTLWVISLITTILGKMFPAKEGEGN